MYTTICLKDYKPSEYLIETAELRFNLQPKNTTVFTRLCIKRNILAQNNTDNRILILDGIKLELQSIMINKRSLGLSEYQLTKEHLIIPEVPDNFILETIVVICPVNNLSCTGLYLTNGNFCTQNEPCGFRCITYFIDRPDILTTFTTTIIANKEQYPVLLSNGNLIHQEDCDDGMHSATWYDPFPESAYLFALVAGKFDCLEDHHITSQTKRNVNLRIYANCGLIDQCHHAMNSLKQAMSWEEKYFGLEYDLDIYQIVAVDDFNAGAMENKSLNIFNSSLLLASAATSTDNDFYNVAAVCAHEYFHNWTGNRITCRDWFQIGLKEGLTTLREQLFMEDTYGYVMNRIKSINIIQTEQFVEDSGPMAHPIRLQSYIEVNNFYTTTVYYKSAEVARMLCTIFGRNAFAKILQDFLRIHDGQAITIEDFLQTASEVTRINLEQFKLWYDQAGIPILHITSEYSNKTYTLKIRQDDNKYFPFEIGLLAQSGENIAQDLFIINQNEQEFKFSNIESKPIPSLLRNFSAPVKMEYAYTNNELLILMCNDHDPINAWQASQKLMLNVLLNVYNDYLEGVNSVTTRPYFIFDAFKKIIKQSRHTKNTKSLTAFLLTLPTESHLFEMLATVDIEAMHYASETIKLEMARYLRQELLDCYNDNRDISKEYSLDSAACGRRKLKNLCLSYLMNLNTPEIYSICLEQLEHSTNMTDTQAALSAIANSEYDKKDDILNDYYSRWKHQSGLVDRWLAINASIGLPNTLQRVQNLLSHNSFNIRNPNKVYALIRTFCGDNYINFHDRSGAGYEFLTKQVLAIDSANSQLAAAIFTPFTYVDKLNNVLRDLIIRQIKYICSSSNLSKNVYEIANKVLTS